MRRANSIRLSSSARTAALRTGLVLAAALAVRCGGDAGSPEPSGGATGDGTVASQSLQATRFAPGLAPSNAVRLGAPAAANRAGSAPRRPDEMLVTFRAGTDDVTARARSASAGHRVQRRFQLLRFPSSSLNRSYQLQIPAGADLDLAMESMRRDPAVEAVQPNFVYQASSVPNDPYFFLQWAQANTGDNSAHTAWGLPGVELHVAGTDIAANAARDVYASLSISTVVVGIVDSGVDYTHPDLAARIWQNPGEIAGNGIDDDGNGYVDDVRGWDFKNNDSSPMDDNAHGTHVAGVVGAIANNGIGVAGTAPNARIMPLKFLGADGSGATADAVSAVNYGVDNGAQVLNNSWGGGGADALLQSAIDAASTAGVLFVAAAGNDGSNTDSVPSYPAGYPSSNIVSVAASTPWRDMAGFSNFGMNSVDLAAPGDQIISTTPVAGPAGVPETSYQIGIPVGSAYAPWSGTSMATPAVSGAAALVFGLGESLWPGTWSTFTPAQRMQAVRDRLLARADRWPSLSGAMASEGHLNLLNLVKTDTTPPNAAGSFSAVAVGIDFVTLRFTAPGDDGAVGRANYYDLRLAPGSTLTYASAPRVIGEWTPSDPGTTETITLTGLNAGTTYAVGLQVGDHAGNTSPVVQLSFTTKPDPSPPLFSDTMESAGSWTAQTPWARTTTTAHSPTHSWTDSPNGNYTSNRNTSLTSPEIVADGASLRLTYWQRYALENGFDFGYVEMRAFDGTTWTGWTSVTRFTGTNTTWHQIQVDLPLTGQRVQLRFRLQSDNLVNADGWYVDDVTVRGFPGADQVAFQNAFTSNDCSAWTLNGAWGCENDSLSDSPGANYPINNRASATTAQPLDFRGTERVRAAFDFVSFDYESGRDVLSFQYSLDGQSWRNLASFTGTASATVPESFGLDFLAGQPKVWFRFLSLSDYATVRAGARIDNFVVRVRDLEHCVADAACSDGVFCNGAEVCDLPTGTCLPGASIVDDGVSCTVDACNEATQSVTHTPSSALCNDGLYCNGVETCSATLGCQSGTPPATSDGVTCTTDSCDEATDTIVHVPVNAVCDDGSFCNGAETCNPTLGCQAGTAPCVGSYCDDGAAACVQCLTNAHCDDGLFCNGAETCAAGVCKPGVPPAIDDGVGCTVDACNEATDTVTHTPNSALCDDGLFCDGVETCSATLGCQAGVPPATNDGVACTADSCDEATHTIVHVPVNAACDDGLFCNGAETCNAVLGCQSASSPCAGSLCDETANACVECLSDADCDNDLYCDGAELCLAGACVTGAQPCPTGFCSETAAVCTDTCIGPACAVTWKDVVGVTATGNDLGKTSGTTGWNAGAASNETLSGDGWVEFTTSSTGTAKAAGLSFGNGGQTAADIDFAFMLSASGGLRVWENGVDRGAFGSYVPGDVLRVQVLSSVVTYYRNGALLYTSAAVPTFPLLVDTSLNGVGATIDDVVLGTAPAIGWQNVFGVKTTIDSLVKTRTTTSYDSGASTHAAFSGDGVCAFTVNAGTNKMAGLNNGDASKTYQDIDYAIAPNLNGNVVVYESGTSRGTFGTYVAGDQFSIESAGGFVQYYKNGSMFYSSKVAPTAPLLFDTSLATPGAEVRNVTIGNASIYWKGRVGIAASGASIAKSATTSKWDAGASTTRVIAGNAYAEFGTSESTKAKIAGLSRVDANRSLQEIEFGIYLTSGGKVQVYESGTLRGTFGAYVAGDRFRVSSVAGVISYSKNGIVFYTSATPAMSPLLLDTALYSPGATLDDTVLSSL